MSEDDTGSLGRGFAMAMLIQAAVLWLGYLAGQALWGVVGG